MIPVQQIVSGQAIGSAISVQDSATLAQVGTGGLTVGTKAWNSGVGAYFTLTVSSAALVTDQVVAVAGISGWRWIVDTTIPTGGLPALAAALPAATTTAQGMMPAVDFSYSLNPGATLTNADTTIQPLTELASAYVLPTGVTTANRTYTLGATGTAITTMLVSITVQPQTHSVVFKNDTGATLLTLAAQTQSITLNFVFSSGHFALSYANYSPN